MKKPQFVLSRKNQKGQVAIFVALIFQIIFVFFALLINIGLIVHHKINLQQSTDLAAYYGAMKQAESLNAIAHINFQIRQAWKLLTWRYRVLGTFGFQGPNPQFDKLSGSPPVFPVTMKYATDSIRNSKSAIDGGACPPDQDGMRVNTLTHPFFCIGHAGMSGWVDKQENNCKVSCPLLEDTASVDVGGIPPMNVVISNGISGSINQTIASVNDNLNVLCTSLGPTNVNVLAKIIVGYQRDAELRSRTLLMLASNLSKDKFVDLDGGDVVTGVKNTLLNNLTEANRTSVNENLAKINTYNSLSANACAMTEDRANAGKKSGGKSEFLKRIEFNLVQFFVHDCKWIPTPPGNNGFQQFRSGSLYNRSLTGLSDGSKDSTGRETPDFSKIDSKIQDALISLIGVENERYTVGYEKNPWCPAYYFVSATAEPMIPFLPLVKIKLSAQAIAKPFGGSIGPWFGKTWPASANTTQEGFSGVDRSNQTDEMLPLQHSLNAPVTRRRDTLKLLPNFSRYVGDKMGLADPDVVAEYHAALIDSLPRGATSFGSPKEDENLPPVHHLRLPNKWPSMNSWKDVDNPDAGSDYDPLTKINGRDSGLRDLEISAITPNQFDLTYYSIDSDFYNNYYKRLKSPVILNKIKDSAGGGPDAKYIRPDLGNNENVYTGKRDFSVRNKIEIVKKVLGSGFQTQLKDSSPSFIKMFPFLVTHQSSLLTSWTFQNFTDFNLFPDGDVFNVNSPQGTMVFGRCNDSWATGSQEFNSPVDSGLPPAAGNCVTGGRSGYSVKLVSPSLLRSSAPPQPLGGVNTNGQIRNPIPEYYFSY